MECEVVQSELATGAVAPELREGVNAHIASCTHCRRSAVLYAGINDALSNGQVWQPPAGFAVRVGSVAAPIRVAPRERKRFHSVSAIVAALVFLAVYLFVKGGLPPFMAAAFSLYVSLVSFTSRVFVANAVALVWMFAATSIAITVWFTRRSLSGG